MRERTETLLRAVTGTAGGQPTGLMALPGTWRLVQDLSIVYAELETGVITQVHLEDVKAVLRSGSRHFVCVMLGRRDNAILWGYITRRYAQGCADWEMHHCENHFSLTVREFLPAVLNAANLHDIDSVGTLKIALSDYSQFVHYISWMLMAEHSCRNLFGYTFDVLKDMIRCTAVQICSLDSLAFVETDLTPPFSDFVVPAQLSDALRMMNMVETEHLLMTDEVFPDVSINSPQADDPVFYNGESPLTSLMNSLNSANFEPLLADKSATSDVPVTELFDKENKENTALDLTLEPNSLENLPLCLHLAPCRSRRKWVLKWR